MTDGNDISCSRSEMKESGNLDQPANRTKTANPIRSVRGYAIETPTQVLWLCNCCDDKNALFFFEFHCKSDVVMQRRPIVTSRMPKTTSSILAFRRKSKNKKVHFTERLASKKEILPTDTII